MSRSFWWWAQLVLAVPALLVTIWFAAVQFVDWFGPLGVLPTVVYAAVMGSLFGGFLREERDGTES